MSVLDSFGFGSVIDALCHLRAGIRAAKAFSGLRYKLFAAGFAWPRWSPARNALHDVLVPSDKLHAAARAVDVVPTVLPFFGRLDSHLFNGTCNESGFNRLFNQRWKFREQRFCICAESVRLLMPTWWAIIGSPIHHVHFMRMST